MNKYRSKAELVDSYRDTGEKTYEEKVKLCDKVEKLPDHNTSLVIAIYQARGTLNLVVISGNTEAKIKVDLKRVPKTDMIHLHRGIGDIIYTDLLEATVQISKLTAGKKRVEELLRKEKVENEAHQAQIKKI